MNERSDVPTVRALLVEDEPAMSQAIMRRLEADGISVELASDGAAALERLDGVRTDWDVVLLDLGLPEIGGLDLLQRFRESAASSAVVMLTGDTSAATAALCLRAGAFHYLTKPFAAVQLTSVVRAAAQYAAMHRQLLRLHAEESAADIAMIGASGPMRRLRAAVERLAPQPVSVLLQGESGTGKELVARALHARSPRAKERFVALNCGAIPESLIDSELFGHVRGAFTGAVSERQGVFVEADGGTLFLDEIGDMPLGVQARLLRVLQESEVRAVGGSAPRTVDVRVIAATHVDLGRAVEQGTFRRDLYYRLNVVALGIPPLRERLDDLPHLAAHFLRKHGSDEPSTLSPTCLEVLAQYPWPGNVRELENAVLHALAFRTSDVIGPEALPIGISASSRAQGSGPVGVVTENKELLPLGEAKRRTLAALERRYLEEVMRRARGSVSEAARMSGTDRTNFRRLLQRYGLVPASFK